MSLDVSLCGETVRVECECSKCGNIHEATEREELFTANITHNLSRMAEEAGIYEALWRPEEIEITKAEQLIGPLSNGLELMKGDPGRFEKLNPENGWGSYSGFVPWVEKYLEACKEYPSANVEVSR